MNLGDTYVHVFKCRTGQQYNYRLCFKTNGSKSASLHVKRNILSFT